MAVDPRPHTPTPEELADLFRDEGCAMWIREDPLRDWPSINPDNIRDAVAQDFEDDDDPDQ